MKSSPRIPNKLSIDSSILIAYFLGEPAGQLTKDEILTNPRREAHCSHLALAETFYILCRSRGQAFAMEAMETLDKTGYVRLHSSTSLDYAAAAIKCSRRLSLADCYVIALAKTVKATATFANRETDLAEEQKNRPFDVNLLFLQDATVSS